MKISKIIAYIIAQLLRLWVTAMTAIAVYCPLSELAYAERGYRAIGGEIVPVILIAGAVWVGVGWLCEEWYRTMRGVHTESQRERKKANER